MRKSYHLEPKDIQEIIKEHFSKRGETVKSVDFKVIKSESGNDWSDMHTYHRFTEAVVFLEENDAQCKECSASS
jgi:hypothetical protein